ncbi:hypothetical protein JCM15519_23080 [Fundidesulfovibrio butyratiphilus]
MSLIINHNMMAMNAARNLNSTYGALSTSTRRLSSGLRVGIAADDAAGLAIREMMRADIASTNQGVRNANDAISMIQVADGALQVVDEKLIRMKELATQAATGTYSSDQRLIIDSEFQAMALEIERIAKATDFNGIKLLQGAVTTVSYTPAYLEDMTAHYTFDGTFADAEGGANVIPYNNVTLNANSVRIVGQSGDFTLPATPAGGYLEVPQVDWSAYSDLTISINVQEDNITQVQNQVSYLTYSNLFVGIHRDNNNIQFRAGPNVLNVAFDSATDRGHLINWTMTLDSDRFAVFKDGALVAEDTSPAALNTPNPAYADEHNIGIVYWTDGGRRNAARFVGSVEDYRIYNKSMSNDDVQSLVSKQEAGEYTVPIDQNSLKVHFGTGNSSAEDYYYVNMSSVTAQSLGVGGMAAYNSVPSWYSTRQDVSFSSIASQYSTPQSVIDMMGSSVGTWHTDPAQLDSATKLFVGKDKDGITRVLMYTKDSAGVTSYNGPVSVPDGTDITTQDLAQKALGAIDKAIVKKDNVRAALGASQNRLSNTIQNLQIQAENLQSSESRISDTDVAQEMTEFTKEQILTQSATAMLAQANSLPKMALQLIQG